MNNKMAAEYMLELIKSKEKSKSYISKKNVFMYIDSEDKIILNIQGITYFLDGSFNFYEINKKNTYASGELDGYKYTKLSFSMHIERRGMSSEVYNFLSSKANDKYDYEPITIYLSEDHKLNKDCNERRYWFENFCFNSGLDYSIQFYLNSEDI